MRYPGLFRDMSVRWKFVLTFFTVIFIPILGAGVYLYFQTSNTVISQSQSVLAQNLRQTRSSIQQKIKIIENVSEILAFDKSFRNLINQSYDSENQKLEDFQFNYSPLIETILRQNSSIYAIRMYMGDMTVTEMLNSFYSLSRTKTPEQFEAMQTLMPRKKGWTGTHEAVFHAQRYDEQKSVQVVSYNNILLSTTDYQRVGGALEIEIDEGNMFDMLRDPVMSRMGQTMMVDAGGRVISRNIPDKYGRNIAEFGIDHFTVAEEINTVVHQGKKSLILISVPVRELNASVVGLYPTENFNAEINQAMKQTVILLVLAAFVLGGLIYVITGLLLRRLRRLMRAMKAVQDGNLDVSVAIASRDEFGELGMAFNHMTRRIHDLVETVYKIQLLEREAELRLLESNINPHFLYNTLATITWVARKGEVAEIIRIVNALAKFYRLVLSKGKRQIPLRDELDMVRAYLQIQKVRFEALFDVVYRVEPGLEDHRVIKNILQPLVENALNHGIEPKRAHGTLIIEVKQDGDDLLLRVTDDGVGMSGVTRQAVLERRTERPSGGGYALNNIQERLEGAYGGEAHFEIYSRRGIGTEMTVRISVTRSREMD